MFRPEEAFYLGSESKEGFSGIVAENNFFLVIESESGLTAEEGRKALSHAKEKLSSFVIDSLHKLDLFISDVIKEENLPLHLSLACGYLADKVLYFKTAGSGKIYIKRGNDFSLIIDGESTASGYGEEGDHFVITTAKLIDALGGEQELNKSIDDRNPSDVVLEITPVLKSKDDQGEIAIFLKLSKIEEEMEEVMPVTLTSAPGFKIPEKRRLTMIVVVILAVILLWSVVLGFQRRSTKETREKINLAKELVSQKLASAEEVAFLNMARARILISESKEELEKLKKLGVRSKELGELEKIIKEAENKILKKEEKKYSEFFDLKIDDKNASGDKIYLEDDTGYILDRKRGTIYQLSFAKKSLDKNINQEIKLADLVAGYEGEKFFYIKGQGVYMISEDDRLKKIIENDKNWGEIINIQVYNGNIYLMDKEKDEIYKYLKTGDGYGTRIGYFQSGQAIDLLSIRSFAIDGSVYLAGDSVIVKYTSGLRDGFSINFPDKNIDVDKILTNAELEKIYLWSKSRGTVYVTSKTGEYLNEISSEILAKAKDIVVFKDQIYALSGNKIYKIE